MAAPRDFLAALRRWLGPVLLVPVAWLVVIAAVLQDRPDAAWRAHDLRVERWDGAQWQLHARSLPLFVGDYAVPTRRLRLVVPYAPDPADASPRALFLARTTTPLTLRLGDETIAALPSTNRLGCARGDALLLNLPPPRDGLPLVLEMSVDAGCAFLLGGAFVGPYDRLLPAYQGTIGRRLLGRESIVTTALLLALIVLAIWRRRPHDTAYAYFALGLTAWAMFNLGVDWDARPGGINAWQAFLHVCLAAFVASMTVFVHRFEGRRFPRGERALWLGTAATSIALFVLAATVSLDTFLGAVMTAHRLLLVGVGAYMAWRLLRFAMRERGAAARWLLAGQATALSFGVNDVLFHLGWIETPLTSAIGYGLPVVLSVFGAILAARFADALRDVEASNRVLDAKVREKSRALEAEFARTRELERDRVLAGERERIMRDMHDGLGGQLVTLLAQVRGGHATPQLLESALVDSLDDLRLIIDSMDRESGELSLALGMLRQRMAPRLAAARLAVAWDTARLPDGLVLGPEGTLNVLRVVQEAAQNVVKHAQATRIAVRARLDASATPPMLEVTVSDDGVGLGAMKPGRGMGNLRRRALALGGTFAMTRVDEATVACLRVPLPASRGSDA